jgi:hypothetical protein
LPTEVPAACVMSQDIGDSSASMDR